METRAKKCSALSTDLTNKAKPISSAERIGPSRSPPGQPGTPISRSASPTPPKCPINQSIAPIGRLAFPPAGRDRWMQLPSAVLTRLYVHQVPPGRRDLLVKNGGSRHYPSRSSAAWKIPTTTAIRSRCSTALRKHWQKKMTVVVMAKDAKKTNGETR
jgi:hypothetical protein